MRIAITNPTNWPYLRRGAERFINELASFFAQRGHDVTIISGKPGKGEVVRGPEYVTIYHRRLWHPVLAKVGFLEFHAFFFPVLASLLRGRYDAVICVAFMDGFAAKLARHFTGAPYIYVATALPPRVMYFRSLTLKGAVFKRAVLGADGVVAISRYVSDYLYRRWGAECVHIPCPVDLERFQPLGGAHSGRPIILCAAALDDPRKGGRVLMRAFNRLKGKDPDSLLQVAYPVRPETQRELLELVSPRWRPDVQFTDGENLPELYARASISVLPSLWEPQGMVVLESMAAGTPVVGTRDGALPEIISDTRIGRLFDPGPDTVLEPTNVEGLARAMEECLELSRLPETAHHCRKHSEQFSWKSLGPRFEELLQHVTATRAGVAETVETRA